MIKKILLGILSVFIILQFFRPAENDSMDFTKDISTVYKVPADVQQLLQQACYDCHSNNTTYPWYDRIQPVAWFLQNHIEEGKKRLNFSEFASYAPKKQAKKLKELSELVEKKEMPLDSYTWMHSEARLSDAQRFLLINWAKALQMQIQPKQTP